MAHAEGDTKSTGAYFSSALFSVGLAALAAAAIMNWQRSWMAFLFMGSDQFAFLIPAISVAFIGITLHSLCYAYFRGTLEISHANILQMVNMGVVPLLVFSVWRTTVEEVMYALGICWVTGSLIAMLFIPTRHTIASMVPAIKQLLRYGLPRVPGDFAMMGFLALPVTLVAHLSGVREAGYAAFGISVLTAIGSVFTPVGVVLLPQASRLVAKGALQEFKRNTLHLLKLGTGLALLITLAGEILAGPLITLYLGPEFFGMVGIFRIVILAALPYATYILLRNVIDAVHVRPVNMFNILISFAIFLGSSLAVQAVSGGLMHVLVSFVVGISALGILSGWETRKIFSGAEPA
ncbi:MAG: hypothetical protein HYX73_10005 [Acidobacteria bacterium]|nr:hypothetical protein [Acidobacteriota bacterium]